MFREDLANPLGMGQRGEERSQQVVCYRGGMRLGDWIWGKEGEVKSS